MRNVLVTGASGFIGQALCKKMLTLGWRVRGTSRSNKGIEKLAAGIEPVKIESIGLETDWTDALKDIDTVVHLAARVHVTNDSAYDPLSEYWQVNVSGTDRFAKMAVKAGVRRFIYISSVKVNGESTGNKSRDQGSGVRERRKSVVSGQWSGKDRSQKSEVRGQEGELKEAFSEKDVPEPQDPYAVSKWEAEQVLKKIAYETGLEVVILRPPLVYGPCVKANFLRLFKIVERGIPLPFAKIDNRRSFIYLDNMIDAIITCINHPGATGGTFLVNDGEDVSTPELIRRIALALGKPARLFSIPLFLMRLAGKLLGKSAATDRLFGFLTIDSTKIRRELGWKPPYTMKHGLKETAKWYKKSC